MLERMQLFPLNFYKKEKFNGSIGKMNFRLGKLEKETEEGEKMTILLGTVWEGPFCYDVTEKEKMENKEFPFSEDGITMAMEWLNQQGKVYNN